MKRSQLKKLIRESIKQLMTEQSSTGGPGHIMNATLWDCSSQYNSILSGGNPVPQTWGGTLTNAHYPGIGAPSSFNASSGQGFGCLYVEDSQGNPYQGNSFNIFQVMYQGQYYSVTGGFCGSAGCQCPSGVTATGVATLVNGPASGYGSVYHDNNGPWCPVPGGGQDEFHNWRYLKDAQGNPGCPGTPNSMALYSASVPGGAYSGGMFNNPPAAAAQTAVWNAWGQPVVGEIIKVQWTWQGVTSEICIEYLGTSPTQTSPNGTLGSGGGLNDVYLGMFPTCEDCYGLGKGFFHEFLRCDQFGPGYPQVLYSSQTGLSPGGTGGSPTQPWATHQNSDAFWQFLGSPTPGQIVGFDVTPPNPPYHMCLEYLGTVQSGQHSAFPGGNTLSNVTPHPSCNDCLNPPTPGIAVQACDCNQYQNMQGTCNNQNVLSTSYPITIGGNAPQPGDTFQLPNNPTIWTVDILQNPVSTCAASIFANINCDFTPATCSTPPNPCPNGIIQMGLIPAHPDEGKCKECLANFTSPSNPSPWPNITGVDCECCEPPQPSPCKKCCCEDDGQGGCIPGTQVFTVFNLDPCDCATIGLVEQCKPPGDDDGMNPVPSPKPTTDDDGGDISPLSERLQKLANIKK